MNNTPHRAPDGATTPPRCPRPARTPPPCLTTPPVAAAICFLHFTKGPSLVAPSSTHARAWCSQWRQARRQSKQNTRGGAAAKQSSLLGAQRLRRAAPGGACAHCEPQHSSSRGHEREGWGAHKQPQTIAGRKGFVLAAAAGGEGNKRGKAAGPRCGAALLAGGVVLIQNGRQKEERRDCTRNRHRRDGKGRIWRRMDWQSYVQETTK